MGNGASKSYRIEAPPDIRLVILGKKGTGKSATGNTILGIPRFSSMFAEECVIRSCVPSFAARFDKKIVIVDTPGIFASGVTNDEVHEEIQKCVNLAKPGPHGFIFVLSAAARYTQEDELTIQYFEMHFGEEFHKFCTVIFTRKEELDARGISLEDHIKQTPERLQSFILKCEGGVFALNNNIHCSKQDKQVKKILKKIAENSYKTFYSEDMYNQAKDKIKEVKGYCKTSEGERKAHKYKLPDTNLEEEKKVREKMQEAEKIIKSMEEEYNKKRFEMESREAEAKIETLKMKEAFQSKCQELEVQEAKENARKEYETKLREEKQIIQKEHEEKSNEETTTVKAINYMLPGLGSYLGSFFKN